MTKKKTKGRSSERAGKTKKKTKGRSRAQASERERERQRERESEGERRSWLVDGIGINRASESNQT